MTRGPMKSAGAKMASFIIPCAQPKTETGPMIKEPGKSESFYRDSE